jgi:hypothetical protein
MRAKIAGQVLSMADRIVVARIVADSRPGTSRSRAILNGSQCNLKGQSSAAKVLKLCRE